MAVLGAAARLEGDDALDLDLVTVVLQAHLMGELQQLLEAIVTCAQHLDEVVVAERLALLEHDAASARQNVLVGRGSLRERCVGDSHAA